MDTDMIVGDALQSLHIRYRQVTFPGGVLRFCRTQEGMTFNVQTGTDGSVRIWRFIRTDMPTDRSGSRIEYCMDRCTVGLEITPENELTLFSVQRLDAAAPGGAAKCFRDQLDQFLRLNDGVRARYRSAIYG